MARVKLTARKVEALGTDKKQEDFWDALTQGLCLRVSGTTSRKTWLVRYRANGRHRRTKLGDYPQLSIADARKAARDALVMVDAGDDRGQKRADQKAGGDSFREMVGELLDAKDEKGGKRGLLREATKREYRRIADTYLLPDWGHRPAGEITIREIRLFVDRIARRAPGMANRILALTKMLFQEGWKQHGFPGLDGNPAADMTRPAYEPPRERLLTRTELGQVWAATEPESPLTRGVFRLAILTAQRVGAIRSMRWQDIDGDLWTSPAEHNKSKRIQTVPLSREALAVVAELEAVRIDPIWVFPARKGTKVPHMTNTRSAMARIRKRSGIAPWRVHDFRRAFRSTATKALEKGGLGVAPHIADLTLGHAEDSLGWSHYQGERHLYLLTERAQALKAWGAFVRAAVAAD